MICHALRSPSMADDKHKPEPTQTIPAKDGDIEVPIPSRKDFLSVVEKVVGGGFRKRPAEKDQHPGQSD
jgi:hypothetical protein